MKNFSDLLRINKWKLFVVCLLLCESMSAVAMISTGPMVSARAQHTATALADGRVLMTGGWSSTSAGRLNSAEIYDPATGQFTQAASMSEARAEHVAIRLLNGRVLVMGGAVVVNGSMIRSNTAEIYDPQTNTWSYTGAMSVARARFNGVLLQDGRVLVVGGVSGFPEGTSSEIYDPATGGFSSAGYTRDYYSGIYSTSYGVSLLPDGRVLKSGGYGGTSGYLATAEVWNPATLSWSYTGSMLNARAYFMSLTLGNGKVMVASGGSNGYNDGVELYDPVAGIFSPVAPMPTQINDYTAQTLLDGSGLILGNGATIYHYNPDSNAWNRAGFLRDSNSRQSVTLLADGKLLIAGGASSNTATNYAAIYDAACATSPTSLSSTTQTISAAGGNLSIAVTIAANCRWEVTGLPSWITVDAVNPRTGATNAVLTVSTNTGASRSAILQLANMNLQITQGAAASSAASSLLSSTASSVMSSVVSSSIPASSRSSSSAISSSASNVSSSASSVINCAVTPLNSGVTIGGSLSSADCKNGARGSNYYVDRFSITGAPGKSISIFVSSANFDTYVYLKNPAGTVITSNDDGGGGTNSRIPAGSGFYVIPAGAVGTYTLEVTSYSSLATGSYSVTYMAP